MKQNFIRCRYCFWVVSFIVVIDINFLIFCKLCRKRRKELFSYIYIFIQFGNVDRKERCENEIIVF